MTDNEIIKALECHKSKSLVDCERCPLYAKKVGFEQCHTELFDCVFDLINRQKEDIEELEAIVDLRSKRKFYSRFVKEVFQKEKGKELTHPDFDYIYKLYFEQKAEIERLNALLICKNKLIEGLDKSIGYAYDKAIKEFAERLKEELIDKKYKYVTETNYSKTVNSVIDSCVFSIDNLVKEMTEATNPSNIDKIQ